MTLTVQLPEIKTLLNKTDKDFALFAANALLPHQLYAASFNAASGAPLARQMRDRIYLMSFDRQPFVRAATEVLTAYDQSSTINLALREKFVIAYAKDKLRHLPHGQAYRQSYDDAMAKVAAEMRSIGSLVWIPTVTPKVKNGL